MRINVKKFYIKFPEAQYFLKEKLSLKDFEQIDYFIHHLTDFDLYNKQKYEVFSVVLKDSAEGEFARVKKLSAFEIKDIKEKFGINLNF